MLCVYIAFVIVPANGLGDVVSCRGGSGCDCETSGDVPALDLDFVHGMTEVGFEGLSSLYPSQMMLEVYISLTESPEGYTVVCVCSDKRP